MAEQEMIDQIIPNAMEGPAMLPTKAPTGMLDSIKEQLNFQTIMDKIRHSKDKFFEIGLYAGIGFISGFLLKKYSVYVGVCILALVGLGVLHHLEVINVMVNWDKVNELFGIQAAQNVTADSLIATVWEWIKVNMVISISYFVGLFVGLKVG